MAVIQPLVDVLMKEIAAVDAVPQIIPYIPKFASHVNSLAIPGGEKKVTVIAGLHTLADALLAAGKIAADLKTELDTFIDTVVPVTVDTVIMVARGDLDLKKAEVAAGGCLAAWMSLLCRNRTVVAAVAPVVAAVAPEASTVVTETPITTAVVVAESIEIKVAEASEASEATPTPPPTPTKDTPATTE